MKETKEENDSDGEYSQTTHQSTSFSSYQYQNPFNNQSSSSTSSQQQSNQHQQEQEQQLDEEQSRFYSLLRRSGDDEFALRLLLCDSLAPIRPLHCKVTLNSLGFSDCIDTNREDYVRFLNDCYFQLENSTIGDRQYQWERNHKQMMNEKRMKKEQRREEREERIKERIERKKKKDQEKKKQKENMRNKQQQKQQQQTIIIKSDDEEDEDDDEEEDDEEDSSSDEEIEMQSEGLTEKDKSLTYTLCPREEQLFDEQYIEKEIKEIQ
ncbi:MAG: hypothetical protein EZS28_031179, partial [Streblomastix strix]